ncbi:IS1 family transposase [Capnocytophaga canis]|uniref:IS1 family transposase n=1 Tax=Capnocytophaga canis TaxID=1848903 RepID=UPI00370D88C2
MLITIKLHCPNCQCTKIVKNGNKKNKKQNYLCKTCKRQFIGDHNLTYKGWASHIAAKILLLLARNVGIRDIAEIEKVSIKKVLSVLVNFNREIKPKQNKYKSLQVDELWIFVGKKKNKKWLIYAYSAETKEIVAWVWGKRNIKTAQKLREKLKKLGVSFDEICTYNWEAFASVFQEYTHKVGKKHTTDIEGNNTLLRHRIRRAVRKTCCFSKKFKNHIKAFEIVFFYINFGWI